jgi:hypothetical protein
MTGNPYALESRPNKKTSMTIIYHYLTRGRIFFLSFVLAFFSLTGCQKQPTLTFGPSYVADNNGANIVVVDTTTVQMSTVFVDSTATSGTGFLQVGQLADPYFGTINTRSFFQLLPPGNPPALTVYDSYDSMSLILLYKKGNPFYGDSTVPQTYIINQVDTIYAVPDFSRGFFSNSSLPLNPTVLGSTTATFLPSIPTTSQFAGDSLKIRLTDNLGTQLYNMIYSRSDTILRPATWQNWFHGLCLSPGPGSHGALVGFRDSAIMRIYYHEASAYPTQKFIDFGFTNKFLQFNNVTTDWSSSPLKNLVRPTQNPQTPPATPSSATGNAAYLQNITGLTVKLTFPNLKSIAYRQDYIQVLRAQLTVRPVPGSFSTMFTVPPQVTLYQTDFNNLEGPPESITGASQTGALTLDYLHPLNTQYTYDVTPFIRAQIANTSTTADQQGLMLSVPPPGNTASFARVALADHTWPSNSRVTLAVYYISLYPHN